jgi:SAM-dependent methyltransferase
MVTPARNDAWRSTMLAARPTRPLAPGEDCRLRDYEHVAARFWNLASKGREEAEREGLFMDDIVQKAHVDREIARHLTGIETVFDGGAGVGRFSIPLALRGLRVTHFDISLPMLEKARERAAEAGVTDRIDFVHGRLGDLTAYADGQFDLVLSLDAPVSYTYPGHTAVLRELVRLARKALIVSVVSRIGSLPMLLNPAQKEPFLVDPDADDPQMRWYARLTGDLLARWQPDFEAFDRLWSKGLANDPAQVEEAFAAGRSPWPVTYCFLPDELRTTLEAAGLRDVELAGPGALARTLPQPLLHRLLFTPAYRGPFLDRCYAFDRQPWAAAFGKDTLLASGRKEPVG